MVFSKLPFAQKKGIDDKGKLETKSFEARSAQKAVK